MKTNSKTKVLKKILKWALIAFSVFVTSFIIFAMVVSFFYKEKVKNFIVEELNKNLRTEISVDQIDLSLLKKFPYATLTFHKLTAKDATEKEKKDTLLKAEIFNLNFNIIDIFRENYRIKAIDIINAEINLKVFSDNSDNFTFWQESSDTTQTSFDLDLKKISCDNVHIKYIYTPLKQLYDFNIIKGQLKGRFREDVFKSSADADLLVNKIQIGELVFLNNKKTTISLELNVENDWTVYKINTGNLCLGNMCFDITGAIEDNEETALDINISGNDIDLPAFIDELPEQYKKSLADYKSKGTIHFKTSIKGKAGDGFIPLINVWVEMEKGTLNYQKNNISLDDISFKGHFSNGEKQNLNTSFFRFENFKASLPQGQINGFFSIENLDYPILKIEADAKFSLKELFKFLKNDMFDEIAGGLDVNIMFNGKIKDLTDFKPEDFINSSCHGKAELSNTSFIVKKNKKKFKNVDGIFQFNNNDILIETLVIKTENSDFTLKGYLRNALSYIFIPDQKLSIDAKLKSEKLLIDELLISNAEKKDTTYKLTFSEHIDYKLDIDVNELKFAKFKATKLLGNVELKNRIFKAENISFGAFDGTLTAKGTIDGRLTNTFLTQCKIKLQKTDINRMFVELENFGQKELMDKNLKGRLTTEIDIIFKFDSKLDVDLNSLYSFADITIENGELIDYAPIKELSKFIKVSDLSHIKFETLKNRIEIKDRTIHFPNMVIKSSALNIEALGTHTFDNKIDYRLKLLLSEILGKKAKQAKKENDEFGIVEDDGLGRTTLFIKITGTVDNPNIGYDSKGVFEKNKNTVKDDIKNTIDKIGEELFRKNDTIVGLETEKQKEKKKKRKDNEILEDFKIE